MKGSLFMFLLRNVKFEWVHLYDDDGQNIMLIVPRELIPFLRFICRLSDCKFGRVK